eukprot:3963547-Pyramimonas_sp.AAC.1
MRDGHYTFLALPIIVSTTLKDAFMGGDRISVADEVLASVPALRSQEGKLYSEQMSQCMEIVNGLNSKTMKYLSSWSPATMKKILKDSTTEGSVAKRCWDSIQVAVFRSVIDICRTRPANLGGPIGVDQISLD